MSKVQFLSALLLASGTIRGTLAAVPHVRRDGSSPGLQSDPNSSKYCTWWIDYSTAQACSQLLSDNAITLTDFRRWNPSINANCDNLTTGRSYCVEAFNEPPPSTSTSSSTKPAVTSTTTTGTSKPTTTVTTGTSKPVTPVTTSTSSKAITTSTSTKSSNGITTPTPTQPNMVDNCDKFYYVKSGDSCEVIARDNGITPAQFLQWNPSSGSKCDGLWANAYACVSIIGHEPTPTTSSKGNGVATPTPTQSGMVSNCNKFHYVEDGQNCQTIASKYSITVSQFTTWNPAAKSDCTGLWSKTYACVGLIGTATTTTSTKPNNGISTPTPTQPNMVDNCDSFYYVKSGDTCAAIAKSHGISQSQFVTWNPSAGNDCKGLWANAYACISIIGHTPNPTTTTNNGVSTPTPTQDGMTKNCKSFHYVKSGDTCATIANQYKITTAKFYEWNPAVGSECKGLWTNTYACVAVL